MLKIMYVFLHTIVVLMENIVHQYFLIHLKEVLINFVIFVYFILVIIVMLCNVNFIDLYVIICSPIYIKIDLYIVLLYIKITN
jgi:hypothetical protein